MVVDASVMIAWLINEPHLSLDDSIFQLLAERTINVPPHWPAEIANALVVNIRRGRIQQVHLDAFDQRLGSLDLVIHGSPTFDQIKKLVQFAGEQGLTAYDAAYVRLALHCNVTLVTLDSDMRAAAQRLNIPLLPT
jgi:predicted nucleic acid-binding protein